MNKYICIHGHFYQPPRENAWLEEIELQESAHPYHDWNERIAAECYEPNTASRILDEEGYITDITNNYSRISFNFGPTLLSWMELHSPDVYQSILDADRLSMSRFGGHGSALAQVYNHMIMPLSNPRDKETQVIWGIKDFEHRFKRKPEGMWLAETAVDTATLEVLADQGIKYTILAPRQAKAFRRPFDAQMNSTGEHPVDSRFPYRYTLPSGKEIILFFYDGDRSQGVAFNNLLSNGKDFAESLISGVKNDVNISQMVHIATDGESYGHHHRHGDMALAYCLDYIDKHDQIELSNYGYFLSQCEEIGECEIHENSSWSCVHGVERWKADCGCHSGGRPDWNQKWRKPLREALDWLRDRANESYETQSITALQDPWKARNKYIDVILDRESGNIHEYLNSNPTDGDLIASGMRWLEMQRNLLLMYTSCGWFFDEVSGIETTQILQYACRAIQLHKQLTGEDLEPQFYDLLEKAPSNMPEFKNAAEVYMKYVIPTRLNLARVGMHYAVSSLFEKDPDNIKIFNYTVTSETFSKWDAGLHKLVCGSTHIRSNVTYSEKRFNFAVLYLGQHNIIGNISLDMDDETFEDMKVQLKLAFEESRIGEIIGYMQTYFGPEKYTLWHLFRDQKRKVINQIMYENLRQVENSFRKIYNRDYPLINMMKVSEIPIPNAYQTTIEYVMNADLRRCLNMDHIDLNELKRLAGEFKKWDIPIDDNAAIEHHAEKRVLKTMKKISNELNDTRRIQRLNLFFEYIGIFELDPDLSKGQNLYFYILNRASEVDPGVLNLWKKEFEKLGENLKMKVIR